MLLVSLLIAVQTSATHAGKTGTSTPVITTSATNLATAPTSSKRDKILLPTPTPAAVNRHCQVYHGGSMCHSYRQNKEIFWRSDHQHNQTEWGSVLEGALDTFRMSTTVGMSPVCAGLLQQIACYWFFPQCSTSSKGRMASHICNESCQLLRKHPCWNNVVDNLTMENILSIIMVATSEITNVSALPCQYQPPPSESAQCENITTGKSTQVPLV